MLWDKHLARILIDVVRQENLGKADGNRVDGVLAILDVAVPVDLAVPVDE